MLGRPSLLPMHRSMPSLHPHVEQSVSHAVCIEPDRTVFCCPKVWLWDFDPMLVEVEVGLTGHAFVTLAEDVCFSCSVEGGSCQIQ